MLNLLGLLPGMAKRASPPPKVGNSAVQAVIVTPAKTTNNTNFATLHLPDEVLNLIYGRALEATSDVQGEIVSVTITITVPNAEKIIAAVSSESKPVQPSQ